jgi:4-amino-4-deoxy-L-arabinose transferase-like glycosyltransferase
VGTHQATKRPCIRWLLLACLLATSCILFLQNLGTPDITTWDEVVHVNVVKNLAERCCVPRLHRSSLGTDYRDWGNNTLWLHKPLLPFYMTAAIYKILGGSLWAFRFSGALFALLTAVVVFLTGSKMLDDNVGLVGAGIFSLNPFTNALVHGRTYSGFPDLFLVFFISLALYLVLEWTQTKSIRTLRWLGLVVGLAYLSKGGLALGPFVVLVLVAILTHHARDLVPALQSVVVFALVVLPERLYWLRFHPVEAGYEQQQQFLHLFRNIEGHAYPWHAYFTHALPHILAPALIPFVYFSLVWALMRFRPGTPGHTLSIWSLAYLVPLSFSISKIENFIFPVLPAIALLVPLAVETLLRNRQFKLVLSLCVASFATYVLWQTIVLSRTIGGIGLVRQWSEHPYRFIFLGLIATLTAALALRFVTSYDFRIAASASLALTSLGVLLIYVHMSITENWIEPLQFNGLNSSAQLPLRQTATDLRGLVDGNALIIVALDGRRTEASSTGLFACGPGTKECVERLAHLYLMYWSDVDVLDVCREPQAQEVMERLQTRDDTYLITNRWLPAAPLAAWPLGELYSLGNVPFEVWGPAAIRACQ